MKKKDTLYNRFYDPSLDFLQEPRAFCYDLATQFINQAKNNDITDWYDDTNTIKGILLLLFTWNFAAKKTKKLNFHNVGQLINNNKKELKILEKYSIENADENAWPLIKKVFGKFKVLLGQTGASKALGLLNPKLFVMWDTKIRAYLTKSLIPGIMNGKHPEHYVIFLKGIQKIIKEYHIKDKLPLGVIVAKKVDEYNYVKIIMNKKNA